MPRIRLFLILAAIAAVYFCQLGHPLLWADEADTGILSRNVLRSGYPTAFDGRNVSLADDGAQLNQHLLSKKIPWVQYYVGALSLAIFGNDTAGLRALFALCGLLAFFPIRAVLRDRVRYPDLVAALALLTPQVVLLQRSARYYPLLVLLYALLLWHLSHNFKSAKARWGGAGLLFVLFFHTHPFAAACSASALVLFCLALRRDALVGYLAAAGAGFLSWLAWYELLGPPLAPTPLTLGFITSNFAFWWKGFSLGVTATLVDVDAVGCLPLLLWAAALAWLGWRNRPALRQLGKDPLFTFVLLNLLVQAVATGAVFGPETAAYYAILRYMPHLLVFAVLAGLLVLNSAVRSAGLYLALCLVAVGTNFLTWSHWAAPMGRQTPASWAIPVYAEILHPPVSAWEGAIARLRTEASAPSGRDKVVVVWPPWTKETMIFYLGDLALIRQSTISSAPPETNRLIGQALGAEVSHRLSAQPEWLVDLVGIFQVIPTGYVADGVFPSYSANPDNGARPELTRHAFSQAAPMGGIRLYRLRSD
jgi:hypothetical protein